MRLNTGKNFFPGRNKRKEQGGCPDDRMELLTDNGFASLPPEPVKTGLGLALLLETGEVTAYLYDLPQGKCIGAARDRNGLMVLFPGCENLSGNAFEEMLIHYAEETMNSLQLTSILREQVFDMTDALAKNAGRGALEVVYITIAGTTLMQHLYAAMPVKSLRGENGVPLSYFGEEILAEPTMYYFPCASREAGGIRSAEKLAEAVHETSGMEVKDAAAAACLALSEKYRKMITK